MAAKLKDNNFYARLLEKQEKPSTGKPMLRQALPAILLGGLCVAVFAGIMVSNFIKTSQLNTLNRWITDAANVEQYTQAVTKQSFLAALNAKQTKVDGAWKSLDTYPMVQSSVFSKIERAGGETIAIAFRSYDAATGILAFEASSSAVLDIPDYVRKLEATALFHTVTYTGYGYNAATQMYGINISCVMRAADTEG